jgi:iron-sulfur cluster insertion protein
MSQPAEAVFQSELTEKEFKVTPGAAEKLAALFSDAGDEVEAIRVYVTGGGCSGMTYGMTFADARHDHDAVLKGEGFNIYVDSVALGYLKGVEIDYVDRPTGASFVFNNVFSATGGSGACGGCGSAGGGCA